MANLGDDELIGPAPAVDVGADVLRLSSGAYGVSTCAMTDTNALRCWGYNVTDMIGDDEVPPSVGEVPFHTEDAPN
jgi:Regulator of chromosome condensation (RCC1) repeat